MKNCVKIFFAVLFMMTFFVAQSQDFAFTQAYSTRLYLNPALTGSTECGRIGLNYRNQWPNIAGSFSMINASYDQHINALHGGIGVVVNHFMEGNNAFSNSNVGISYSFDLKASESCHLLFGAQANLVYRRINWENLTFANEFDPYLGYIGISMPSNPSDGNVRSKYGRFYPDFAVGFLASFTNWYFGFAAHHLSRPNIGFQENYHLDMKFTAHAGGRIYFAPKNIRYTREHWFYLAPNLIYQNQGNNNLISYGLQANYYPIMIGVQLKNTFLFKKDPAIQQDLFESLSFLVGFEFNSISIGYSYDISLTKIMKVGGGAHEISLAYTLPCKIYNRKQYFEPIYCPKF